LPTSHHKLMMKWKGPFEVVERVGITDYSIDMDGVRKIFHVNMLKRYFVRADESGRKDEASGRINPEQEVKENKEEVGTEDEAEISPDLQLNGC
jgi:hypothetical protein